MILICQYYIQEEEDFCGKPVEGKSAYCATHGRFLRKQLTDSRKHSEKKKMLLSKPKTIYKPPNKVSPKRKEINADYTKLADEFKRKNPECIVRVNQYCTGKTESVHHKRGRGRYLLDVSTFLPCCLSCHGYIEAHPKEAKEKRWSESRLASNEPHKI